MTPNGHDCCPRPMTAYELYPQGPANPSGPQGRTEAFHYFPGGGMWASAQNDKVAPKSRLGLSHRDNSTWGTKMGRLTSYVVFRQTNHEVWPKDKQTYVIFPSGSFGQALY